MFQVLVLDDGKIEIKFRQEHLYHDSPQNTGETKCVENTVPHKLYTCFHTTVDFPNLQWDNLVIRLDDHGSGWENGTLLLYNPFNKSTYVHMQWNGYASRIKNQQLLLYPTREDESTISGVAMDRQFLFRNSNLSAGVWPGFLKVFKKK